MLVCFVCNAEIAGNIKNLFMHLKTNHGVHDRHEKYSCRQGQCCRSFSEKYSFSKHLLTSHPLDFDNGDYLQATTDLSFDVKPVDDERQVHEFPMPLENDEKSAELDVTDLASSFICEAKSRTTSLSSVHAIVNSCKHLFETLADDLVRELECIKSKLSERDESIFDNLSKKLQQLRNPFTGVETEYSHASYLEHKGVYIKPTPYTIGSKQSFVSDSVTGMKKPVMELISGQFVSIGDTIKAVHAQTKLVESAVTNCTPTADNKQQTVGKSYASYFDGEVWNSHPLRSHPSIVIRLYGDDFEPANPLGSRKTVYKMCCIYFQFENLPSYALSRTENMFLTLCYYTADVKEFGWKYVLRPLVNELKYLESSGIELQINGQLLNCKVVLSAITGDNLFLNGILGYVESFTASHPCRHCCTSRSDFEQTFVEHNAMVRDINSYDAAVKAGCVTETGIKIDCALNELRYFHAAENHIQDIMHDIFEGICAYDLPLISGALIKRKYFDLSALNHRLQTFDYGYHDSSNKIPVISSVDVEMWTFDACQLWCLTRVLSIAVGDLVNESDDVWHFYLNLRNIMDIILVPVVQDDQLNLLTVLVSEYLQKRTELFPDKSLKNKHHHLIHYARLIRKVGPLTRFWCMRFESKHQHSKRILHVAGNFKNALHTLAVRHQYDVAFRLLRHCDADSNVVVGTGDVVTLNELSDGPSICTTLGNVGMTFELFNANWIEVRGIRYKPGCYVLARVDLDVPVFMHVVNIFIRSPGDNIWLYGTKLVTKVFNSHYHAWMVEKQLPAEPMCVSPLQLIYPVPVMVNGVRQHDDDILLVGLRYHV